MRTETVRRSAWRGVWAAGVLVRSSLALSSLAGAVGAVAKWTVVMWTATTLGAAHAQLSSPIGGAAPPAIGQGAGTHSPNSPFPELLPRSDVVPWSVLTAVKPKAVGKRVLPAFSPEVLALHGSKRRVQGFMMPLAPGAMQTHFLVSSVPLTCSFCTPGGPESLLEVRTPQPVKYSLEGVVVEGTLQVLPDDPQGLFYRMSDAVVVK
jgi:uncharacterized protein